MPIKTRKKVSNGYNHKKAYLRWMVVAQRLGLGGWDEFLVVGQWWGQGMVDDAGWWGDAGVGWSSASGW